MEQIILMKLVKIISVSVKERFIFSLIFFLLLFLGLSNKMLLYLIFFKYSYWFMCGVGIEWYSLYFLYMPSFH